MPTLPPDTKFAPGWNLDMAKAPENGSVILACVYADQHTAFFRGEAINVHGKGWHWIAGRKVEPEFIPVAWMDMPWVLEDAQPNHY